MKTQKISVRTVFGKITIVGDYSPDASNEQAIHDAKEICTFLIGKIPAETFAEVVEFLKNYKKHAIFSRSPEFDKYWEERLEELNNQDELIDK